MTTHYAVDYHSTSVEQVFQHWEHWKCFIADDFAPVVYWMKGSCLNPECSGTTFDPSNGRMSCSCYEELNPRDRAEDALETIDQCLQPFVMGNCVRCGEAGTCGYECLQCRRHPRSGETPRYQVLQRPGENGTLVDPFNWANMKEQVVNVINPMCPLNLNPPTVRITEVQMNDFDKWEDENDISGEIARMTVATNAFGRLIEVPGAAVATPPSPPPELTPPTDTRPVYGPPPPPGFVRDRYGRTVRQPESDVEVLYTDGTQPPPGVTQHEHNLGMQMLAMSQAMADNLAHNDEKTDNE